MRVRSTKLRLLGNGIDLEQFQPRPETRAEVRAELGLPADQVVVGTVGRLVWEKGFAELFTAADHIRARRPDVTFVVIGPEEPEKNAPLGADDIARARDSGVVFLGHRSDVHRLYAAMDVFVQASHREGFPRAAMEAAASGLPIVATDIRGNRQVVEDGVTGRLVPVRDPSALEAGLLSLIEDPRQLARMGAAGAVKARGAFDHQTVISRTLDAYEAPPRRANRWRSHSAPRPPA
jgi:glycosyltransferase involved in cell wall biosynthesis